MPQWAGSCWYELRYLDPTNENASSTRRSSGTGWARDARGDSGGVDLYVGGVEHAVLHLLYARFWHKVLFDLGHVSLERAVPPPLQPGLHPGLRVHGRARHLRRAEPRSSSATARFCYDGQPVTPRVREDGQEPEERRSRPTRCASEYGADTLRLYEMSMGPLDQSRPWDTRAVVGMYRLLQRVWRNLVDEETGALRVVDDAGRRRHPPASCTARSRRCATT